ncbi:dihydrofolate reductase [Pullulanibacillus sp. KACC 23026]|uniref:dihydrofolate reductase n=1 Tax=Pullulanibacillus sp. KACC 23026 TaxID=3028315 RepID=UPI0023B1A7E3|nr:dihydrofolate reductase [Pullulanibacillus sp. KACC 23026]WEG10860.1 dihydrofolate reductase [Pullulanibacillus sp. KACC 23026]
MIAYLVAVDKENLIGKENALPWHLPADLKYFKELTMGRTIIMGRKTFMSIGKALPGRTNVVLTTDPHFEAPGCQVLHSVEEVLQLDSPHRELFIIGGNAVFKAFEKYVDRLYLTQIDHCFEGDTYFTMDYKNWIQVSEKEGIVDEKNRYPHRFLILERPSQK